MGPKKEHEAERFETDLALIGLAAMLESTVRPVTPGAIQPPPLFPDDGDLLPLDLPVNVRFTKAGRYTVEVWFFQEASADVLKMEQPFHVLEPEA